METVLNRNYDYEEPINFYRTEKYIVKQCLAFQVDECGNTRLISNDIFYRRTTKRDAQYLMLYGERQCLDGKRVRVAMCSRSYIE